MTSPPDKSELRRALRVLRTALAAADPGAAERAAKALPFETLPPFSVVSGYHARASEMDPAPLLARLRQTGALTALPVAKDRQSPLSIHAWAPGDALIPDGFGIPSPDPRKPEVWPDLVIAPVLAFDRAGGRLGQGAGHYDRTIAAVRQRHSVFVLGLAYAGQEVAALPLEPHDIPLDAILTENGYIPVR